MKTWCLVGACAAVLAIGACSEDDYANPRGKGGSGGTAGKGTGGTGGKAGSGGSSATGGSSGTGGSSATGGSSGTGGSGGTAGSGGTSSGGTGGSSGAAGGTGSGGTAGGGTGGTSGTAGAAGASDASADACQPLFRCEDFDPATSGYNPTQYVLTLGVRAGRTKPQGGSISFDVPGIDGCSTPNNVFAGLNMLPASSITAEFTETAVTTEINSCGPATLTLNDPCNGVYTITVDISYTAGADGGVFTLSCPAIDAGPDATTT